MDLKKLAAPIKFKWRVQSFSKYKPSASCVAYIDARLVQDRLDEVCGPENWQNDYYEVGGLLFCKIGIKIGNEWIWKGDTGSESNIEKDKGHVSDAFKRAAIHWNVGRFLYSLEIKYVTANEKKAQGNYPHVVDSSGKRIWDLTKHIRAMENSQNKNQTAVPGNDQANRLIKLLNSDKTVADLAKRHKDNKSIVDSLPVGLNKKVMDAFTARKKVILTEKATPLSTPEDSTGEASATQNDIGEPPLQENSNNLPPAFGEGPEFMSQDEKYRIEAGELMTSLSSTDSKDVAEVIANLKKGFIDKFPKNYKDEIFAHCNRLLSDVKTENENANEPADNPGMVKNLKRYIDQCKKDKAGALEQIRKDSFPSLNQADRQEIIKYADK